MHQRKFIKIYKKINEGVIRENLQIFPSYGNTIDGKIILPERILNKLMDDGYSLSSSSPLYFKITNKASQVCVSLLEFNHNADECNLVQVPSSLIEKLGAEILDHVIVENISLQTATYLKIQPIQSEFYKLPDYRTILEQHLSQNYLVLQVGQHICFNYAGEVYDIIVEELKVGEESVNVASIHETDLVLDLVEIVNEVKKPTRLGRITNYKNLTNLSKIVNKGDKERESDGASQSDEDSESAEESANNKPYKVDKFGKSIPFSGKGYRLCSS